LQEERRSSEKHTQSTLKRLLSEEQQLALQKMEATGWKILFIRSRLLLPTVTVLTHIEDGDVVILEEDGSILQEHNLTFRQDESILY
jgi:hypothetical protein